jgi:dolichol kinase
MRLSELNQALRAFKTQEMKIAREYVLSRYNETARAYEAWLMQWSTPAQQRPQSLRTLRGARTWFHIAMGVFAAGMYQFVIDKTQALIILYTLGAIFGTLEITRRFSSRWNEILVSTVFKAISRPGEFHKTNSATYYLLALCFITTLFDRASVITGILVLAFGDPAAAWVGKRFGKFKIYREKSLVGALSFFAAASLVLLAFFFSLHPEMAVSTRIVAALAAAAVGAIAEVFSTRLDDNLTVPVTVVAITALIL